METSPFLYIDKDFGVDDKGRIRLGETVSGGRNGRTITITEIGDVNTMSVVLGHEAYRDGKVGADNEQETRNAVIAHTKMAARMRAEGADFDNSFVGLDLAVYDYARSVGNMEIMEKYADALYDSSGDYWKLTKDGQGNWGWADDGSADFDISEALNDPEFNKNYLNELFLNRDDMREALLLSQSQDGKKGGVISAERMNEGIAYLLSTGLIPLDTTPVQNIESSEHRAKIRRQSDIDQNDFIYNTQEKMQYNQDHANTIRNDRNQPITLWNVDSRNAERANLLKQSDDVFRDIANMASSGCNFMVIVTAAQIITGEKLSAGQIKDIWKNALSSEILSYDGTVENRNALANMALRQLGRNDIGINMDGTFDADGLNRSDRALLGSRISVPFGSNYPEHYILGASSSNGLTVPVYNPGQTGKDDFLFKTGVGIWAYAKKTR